MALNYRLYQSNRKDNTKDKRYARVTHTSTIDTNGLAAIMQANCTVKRSDILAVISELVEVMTTELQNSKRVRIDGFGTFKLGINTKAADHAKDFSVSRNVTGVHVLFLPETKIGADKRRTITFVDQVKLREADVYKVEKSAEAANAGADSTDDAEPQA